MQRGAMAPSSSALSERDLQAAMAKLQTLIKQVKNNVARVGGARDSWALRRDIEKKVEAMRSEVGSTNRGIAYAKKSTSQSSRFNKLVKDYQSIARAVPLEIKGYERAVRLWRAVRPRLCMGV